MKGEERAATDGGVFFSLLLPSPVFIPVSSPTTLIALVTGTVQRGIAFYNLLLSSLFVFTL